MTTAYDYEAQRWVKGEAAIKLLITQAQRNLEWALSDEYVPFTTYTGRRTNREQDIAEARAELRDLGA